MNTRWQRFWLTWLVGLLMLAGLPALLQISLGGTVPVLAQSGTGIIRVAMSGTDTPGCGSAGDPCRTVQYAIDESTAGDEIHVAVGLYTSVSARYGVTQVVYIEETITIRGGYTTTNWSMPDPDANPTVLSALGQGRVVYVTGNITPTLAGLRLTGGSAIGLGGYIDPSTLQEYDGGGAVYAAYATLTITDCQIDTNGAEVGGGVALFQSPARIYNSAVLTNQAGYGGGLAMGYSPAILDGNTIAGNQASYGGGMGVAESGAQITNNTIRANEVVSSGGGIALFGNPPATLSGNLVTENNARWGGGMVISGSTSYVYSNTFMANTSIEVGGGVNLAHCDARLVDNLVQANHAGHSGGGFFFIESTAVLTGNRIISNTSDESGGGLHLRESPARLYGNTIHANSADYAGGGVKMRDSAAQLVNNTISANTCLGTTWDERGGGGVYLHDSNNALLDGNRIVQNMARYYGGGVYLRESAATLTGNTVATNTVDTQSEFNGGGGGFYLDNSDGAVLTDNRIAANLVFGSENTHGGGLFLEGSDAQLTGNRVISNVARSSSSWGNIYGGGLYIEGSNATLTGNTIMSNTVQGDGPDGGGMYVQGGAPTIVSNTLTVNTAERGSGGYFRSSDAIVRYNTVVSNTASWFGGGFYFNSGSVFVDANTVMSNTARTGSGILVGQSTGSVLVNNIVAHNNISGSTTLCKGGGLFLWGAHSSVAHNTFVDNGGSAICVQDGFSLDGRLGLTNTIIFSHTTGVYVESDGSNAVLEHTLWTSNTTDWSGPVTDTNPITGTPDFVDADADDYHIGPASAGLDLGALVDVVSDIDGDPRPADSGYDVGADERPGVALSIAKSATPIAVNPGEYVTYTVLVLSAGASDATSVALTDTLPAEVQVQSVNASQGACTPGAGWGATVTCALGTLGSGAQATITLTVETTTTVPTVLPARLRNVAVVQAAETLSSTAEADSWLQDCHARLNNDPTDYTSVQAAVDAATQDTDVVKVAGGCAGVNTYGGLRQHVYLNKTLTIRGGYTTGDWNTSDPVANPSVLNVLELGRVVYVAGTVMPTLEGLHIRRGDATGLGGYVDPFGGWEADVGGGVYGQGITLTLDGCWIEQSYGVYGGGVYLDAGGGVITASTFTSNTAGSGGGLYLSNNSVALMNNSIAANTANSGGGLYLDSSTAALSGNTVAANEANSGAGLYLERGAPTLSGNTILSNTARFGGGVYGVNDEAIITGNVIAGNTATDGDGGGLNHNNSYSVVSYNTIVSNTTSDDGGGTSLSYSSAQYTGNYFSNNTASAGGGAYVNGDNYSSGTANFIDNTFDGNTASGSGGGLRLVMGTNTISGNVMISNTARRGGGAYLQSMILNNVPQPIYVIGNTAMSNTAVLYGGGFFVSGPRPYLDRNKLIANTAQESGGGLYVNYRCQEPFNNTVIVDNHADLYGGGIYVNGASPQMQHTTLARNTSGDGRAVYIIDSSYDSNVEFTNTILVSSTTGIYAAAGNTAMLNGVLWYSVTTQGDGAGAITVTNAITDDPAFDLDGYHLTVTSQALDQGVDAGVAEDIDGQMRPMGFGFDLGADEYLAPTLLLDKSASADAVNFGGTVTYTLVFSAAAGGTVHNVTLTDTLDGWQQPLAAVSSQGGCALTTGWGGGAVCTIGDMPVGTTVRVTLTAQVSPTTPLQQQISNDALARGDETGASGQTSIYVHFCRARINDGATEYASIQAAVDAASDGDLIKVAGGLCLGASERGGEWQQVYVTKTVTLRGGYDTATWTTSDPDGNPTTLDAMGQGRVFYIVGSIMPVVEGFRITGGDGGLYGGGVYVETASATLNDNHVYGNRASDGGGIYLDYSPATLVGNVVSTNTATTDGAGLYLDYAPALLRDNRVFGNLCPGDYCDGGGLHLYRSDATLTGNAIFSNTAGYGGGFYAYYSDDTLYANTITSNTVSRDGGGALLYYSSVAFSRDVIRANVSGRDGGGLFLSYTSIPRLTNVVIADNQAADNGSGVYNNNALPRIVHTTIARNTGGDGSGVYIAAGTSTALTNTIIVSQAVGVLATGGAATVDGVLWFSNTANTVGSVAVTDAYTGNPSFTGDGYHIQTGSPAIDQGLDAGVTEDVDGEPRPMDLGYDLGADEYPGVGFAVFKRAPATFVLYDQPLTYTIIVTNVGVQGATGVILTDTLDGWQQANTATASQGGCAITAGWGGGAVCTPGDVASGAAVRITLTAQISPSASLGQAMVNAVAATANETANDTQITVYPTDCRARINTDPTEYTYLQDAVDAATPGDLIKVMGGTCVGINTDGGLRQVVYLDKAITIRGGYGADWMTSDPDANPTTIDAQGGGRALYVTGNVNPMLEGLRFANGDATGLGGSPWVDSDAGGGVCVETASPTFSNTHILNSTTIRGGGVYLESSSATFNHSQFYSNTASMRGGAVYVYQSGGSFNNCRFYSNTATSTGGGVYLNRSNVILSASFITANTSSSGGGVYLDNAAPKFYNTVIADNRASLRAGALYAVASSPQMWHTTIARNTHTDRLGIYVTDSSGTFSNVAMTNTILVSQSIGVEVIAGNAATLNGVLWFNNSSGNTSGPVTVLNATSGDPAFAADGYHLTSASQAIDQGVVSIVNVDVDGDTRPHAAGYDLGADEYTGAILPPTAGFDATPTSGTRPLDVTFTDQSVGSVAVWLWRFGDDATSGETNPTHTYTQTGVFTVSQQVTGPGGSDTLTRTNYITVTDPAPEPPGVPTLLAPPNGNVTTTQNVTLYWQAGAGGTPTGYNVELDGVVITGTSTSSATVLAMGVHTWTVRAFNAYGYSDWAAEWTVEVTDTLPPPGVPVLLSPSNGTVTTTQNVTLRWQAGAGGTPTGYNVELDGVVITGTGTSSATVLAMGVHTWTVRAFNAYGYSDWAAEWTVEVTDTLPPPGVPVLLSPSNGTVTTTQNVTLRWQAGAGGTSTGYNVQLDGVVITRTGTSSATVLAAGVHTWTVRAFNTAGYSGWAAEWTVEVVSGYRIYLPLVVRNL